MVEAVHEMGEYGEIQCQGSLTVISFILFYNMLCE